MYLTGTHRVTQVYISPLHRFTDSCVTHDDLFHNKLVLGLPGYNSVAQLVHRPSISVDTQHFKAINFSRTLGIGGVSHRSGSAHHLIAGAYSSGPSSQHIYA